MVLAFGCGKDGGKSSTTINVPQEENPAPPTTGTGTPRPTTAQRNQTNIKTVMDKLSGFSSIIGTGVVTRRNPDGSFSTANFTGSTIVTRLSDTSWSFTNSICSQSAACTLTETFTSNSGNLQINGVPAKINSTSSTSLNVSTTESSGTVNRLIDIRNDKLKYTIRITQNGQLLGAIVFKED
jgi:hypothetical protein